MHNGGMNRFSALLLNLGHALDHLFLLIFATAVASIASDFGLQRWEDLMPYTAGAFVMFGLGSIPAGRLGDLWGRRRMMLVFYFGMGLAALAVALTQTPLQMAVALTVLGLFSSIYHPVGIPFLVQGSKTPGLTIGINGLAGNMGIALAALSTGFWVQFFGWRMAFVAPALTSRGVNAYGLTETSPIIALNPTDHYKETSVGKVIPRTDMRILDPGEFLEEGASLRVALGQRQRAVVLGVEHDAGPSVLVAMGADDRARVRRAQIGQPGSRRRIVLPGAQQHRVLGQAIDLDAGAERDPPVGDQLRRADVDVVARPSPLIFHANASVVLAKIEQEP